MDRALFLTIRMLVLCCFFSGEMGGGQYVEHQFEDSKIPAPFQLISGIERVQSIGKPLNLFCNVPGSIPFDIQTCEWISPDSKHYEIEGDNVYVVNDSLSEINSIDASIIAHSQGSKNCNITVIALHENQLGNWICKIQFQTPLSNNSNLENYPPNLYLSTTLTAKKEIRVKDVRLPKHMRPKHYKVYLTPFLKEDNFTIKGRVEIDVQLIKNASFLKEKKHL